MSTPQQTWAYLFEHPGADPDLDRTELTHPAVRAVLVPVPDSVSAPAVAARLAAEGATLVELCGGMTSADAAAVRAAVPEHVAVGHVTFGAESLFAATEHARVALQGPAAH